MEASRMAIDAARYAQVENRCGDDRQGLMQNLWIGGIIRNLENGWFFAREWSAH